MLDKGLNDMFMYIISLGADPNMKNKHGATLMHKAAKDDNTSLITYLRDKLGFSICETDCHGNTPLHYSCFEGNTFASYWLIGFGQKVNATNNNNDTPLHCIMRSKKKLKNSKIVRELIFKGADKELKNKDNLTPIEMIDNDLPKSLK